MSFECYAKYGSRWSYKGTIKALSTIGAAVRMQQLHRRNKWKIRPEGSRDRFVTHDLVPLSE